MDTSDGGHASVVGANVVVIAFVGGVDWRVEATSGGIAEIASARVAIIAVHWSITASSCYGVAGVLRACISIIAVDWSCNARAIDASDCVAGLSTAVDVSAQIALRLRKGRELASSSWAASISGARIVVIADSLQALATCRPDADVICAGIVVIAGDIGVHATTWNCRIATIRCAKISIRAWLGSVSASIASLAWNALIVGAFIVVLTYIRADAGCTTRAESKATRSARIAWNINASGNDQTVQNAAELREVGSCEHSLNSWNGRCNESNFIDVITRDTNCKEEDASILGSVDHSTEG
jgi:hypothetical protein